MPYTFENLFWNFGDPTNLRKGANPPYVVSDFTSFYPQFGNDPSGNPIVQTTVIQTFINMATSALEQSRWRSAWQMAMGLFVAHYCTLYLQTSVDPNNGASAVAEAGRAQGVTTGESVGDVSYSTDTGSVNVDGWADWNMTAYGRQFATLAKIYGKGGMGIW